MFGIHEPSVPSINSRHSHFTFPNKQGLFSKQHNELNKCCKNSWRNHVITICLVVFHGFPKIPAFVGYIFGYHSFILQRKQELHKATDGARPRLSRKIPKTFQGLLRWCFLSPIWPIFPAPPPHRKSKSTCPLKKEPVQKENTSNHRFSGDMLVLGGVSAWHSDPNECRTLCLVLFRIGEICKTLIQA